MLNIAALRQQQIPLAAEPRSPVPFHILSEFRKAWSPHPGHQRGWPNL